MAKRVSVDRWMFTVTAILVFIGLVMVFSASAVMAKERYGSAYEFLFKQLIWAVAGLAAMFVAMKIDYKRLKHPAFVFLLLGFTTLFLISVFFLDRTHGTHRWFHLGPISFQPSELAKPALILFLAWFLENKTKAMDDWRNTLFPAIAPTTVFLGLIVFQPDLGTALACAGITACVLFVDFSRRLPQRPHPGLYESLFRSPGTRLPHDSIADRSLHWRHDRTRPDGGQTETFLFTRAPHRFHFCRHRRRTGSVRRIDGGGTICNFSVARNPRRSPHGG